MKQPEPIHHPQGQPDQLQFFLEDYMAEVVAKGCVVYRGFEVCDTEGKGLWCPHGGFAYPIAFVKMRIVSI